MIRWLALAAALAFAPPALAQTNSPFIAPAPPKPKIVRLLALADYFDTETLDAFERASGYQVAYDAYAGPADLPEKWREGPYDLVVLSGPALAREIALGALLKLDRTRIPNAGGVQPPVAAKLAAYDPNRAYGIPLGWFATGLIYDTAKTAKRLGGPPVSWLTLFMPAQNHRMADCGIVLPDARDALFLSAFRLMGVDPYKATLNDVKAAGIWIGRARTASRAFPAPDIAGALASGAACLAVGDEGEAEAATARSRDGGAPASFGFVLPREGGAMSIDALAIPRDAPNPAEAYALLDFLLQPDIAARNAHVERLVSAVAPGHDDALKRLWPEGTLNPWLAGPIQTEWARLRAAK